MEFDQIPSYGGGKPISDLTTRGWLARNRRWLFALAGIVILLDVLAAGYFIVPAVLSGPPGGLDGCILSTSGEPVLATVRVGGVTRYTYEDGCFFFPELPPGPNQFNVETSAGVVLTQDVDILPGQAVALGTVRLP